MKAIICTRYGAPSVLKPTRLPDPKPKPGEVRVRICATTVSAADYRIRGLNAPTGYRLIVRLALGWNGPRRKVLGSSVAGVVDQVGGGVSNLKPGDRVLASLGIGMGGYAELVCVTADGPVTRLPDRVSFDEAAALPFGFTTARHFLFRKGGLASGERLLVNGASGAVGVAMVQLAKARGAHVTGVCSGANAALVLGLGADEVIDYTRTDFRNTGKRWDVIADNIGNIRLGEARRLLEKGGRFLMVVDTLPRMLAAPFVSLLGDMKAVMGVSGEAKADMEDMVRMTAQGDFGAVIDRTFAFDDVAAAHAYAETGHKVGNVVLRVSIP
ncbi:MAG: NAD(P)-dependent alcohol dehydrogenase [Pseudorhodobacter sp.]